MSLMTFVNKRAGFGQPFLSSEIFIEGVAQNARESGPNIILIELLDSHYRGVILAREPTAAFACRAAKPSRYCRSGAGLSALPSGRGNRL